MLTIPPQGLNVLSTAPPSTETPDNPKNKQLLFITLNDQILSQIQASHGKGLSVTFGSNACLQIGDQVHKFSNIVPEAHSSPFEVYRHKHSSSTPKIDLLGRVTHKCQVRRGLDSSSMERIKNRTEEAERERNSRKAVFLEKPPPAKRTASVHARHNSSNSRAYLSVFETKSGTKGSGVRSLPSSPLLRPTAGSSTPKYLPIGGSPRIAPISSPRLPPSSPKPAATPLRLRLIHILALGPANEQNLQEKTRALRTELSTCLQDVARKIAPGSTSWELKDESYRDLKPKEWKNYTSKEREMVEKRQTEIVAKLPAAVVEEIPKKRSGSDVSETGRPLAATPTPINSPSRERHTTPIVPAKRRAEDEAVNPVRKVGGGIISTKKKSTKVTPKDPATAKSAVKDVAPSAPKVTQTKKTKVKSAEKIIDSDSDSDVPLEKQIKLVVKPAAKPESKAIGLKGLGISTIEPETRRQIQTVSPPISTTYRSRTSSSSSANSYSPPKKRSPLATNEPVTAHRKKSPVPPSPPPSAKKRPREEEPPKSTDKRAKLPEKDPHKATPKRKPESPPRVESDQKIGQEYHDLANRFRKLYPEYQELHRRLQGLDGDRLAKEKGSVDKLFKMQEQLEKWKAVLWKAAGETRRVGAPERTQGMVGVRV